MVCLILYLLVTIERRSLCHHMAKHPLNEVLPNELLAAESCFYGFAVVGCGGRCFAKIQNIINGMKLASGSIFCPGYLIATTKTLSTL